MNCLKITYLHKYVDIAPTHNLKMALIFKRKKGGRRENERERKRGGT